MTPAQIARAHHCPLAVAENIFVGDKPWHRAVIYYGPMLCYWSSRGWWILNGKHINQPELGIQWRRDCLLRQSRTS